MGNPAQNLPFTWVIKSVTRKENIFIEGGGLCVHRSGIVITVTHGVRPDCSSFKNSIITATHNSKGVRNAIFVENAICQKFGLCLLRLVKYPNHPNEVFDFCPSLDNTTVKLGDMIYSFMMDQGVTLTPKTGSVTYAFRGNVTVPINEDNGFSCTSNLEMRTVGLLTREDIYVSGRSDSLTDVEEGVVLSLRKLNPSLPLIEVYGFHPTTLDGKCGSPVYNKSNDKLIGLFAFSTRNFQFLIPTQIIQQVFVRNMSILGLSSQVGEGSSTLNSAAP